MLKNYIVHAYRHLIRQKVYSIISISGLSLGLACFLIIVLYSQFQFSYDQFHEKKDRIYRLNTFLDGSKGHGRLSYTAPFVADYIKQNIDEVEEVVRFSEMPLNLHYQDKGFQELYMVACDSQLFDVFSFKLLKGHPKKSLRDPNTIVLSESVANKYFGEEDPMDKILITYSEKGHQIPLKVTGILEDVPQNSHIQFNALISFSTVKNFVGENWYDNDWHGSHTYILLNNDADPDQVQKRIDQILVDKVPLQGYNKASLPMQPLNSIFFNPTKDGSSQRGDKRVTAILLTLGLFILFIACLNYINLSTARSLKRTYEVGIRKVLGAHKKQLMLQFLGESVFISFIALAIAFILMQVFIPHLNGFSNILYKINLQEKFLGDKSFLVIALGTTILTGIVSGIYPAMILSEFKTVKALKGSASKKGSISLRKALVIIQYVVSVVMIICSIGLFKIYHFMQTQDFGFNKDHLMSISLDGIGDDPRIKILKDQLIQYSNIDGLTVASKVPMSLRDDYSCFMKDPETDFDCRVIEIHIDENYFDVLDVPFITVPRSISQEFMENSIMIVNETFMDRFGEYYQPGDRVELFNYESSNKPVPYESPEIIGVVKNFKGRNLIFEKPVPAVYMISNRKQNYLLTRLKTEDQNGTLSSIEKTFKNIFPEQIFQYSFVDDEINQFMSIVSPFAKLIFYGTFFAIFISSMGLFALALFTTQQRTKEIGIRKVFGATVHSVSIQLVKQFIKLVLISFLIAGPITFFGFRRILQILPEKIVLHWTLLFVIGIGILLLAIGTVLFQAWIAAKSNPVVTLRYE